MKVKLDNKVFSASEALKSFARFNSVGDWADLKKISKARWQVLDQYDEDINKLESELAFKKAYREWKQKEIVLRDRIDMAEYSVKHAIDEESKKDAEQGLKDLEDLINKHMKSIPKK